MSKKNINPILSCPAPISRHEKILLAHGGGGKLSQQLYNDVFFPEFDNPILNRQHDGAVLDKIDGKLAYTTDSYVIDPIFFPGGNIGELAIYGTVNDLAVCGAKPLYISVGFILEEGFPIADLKTIVKSMRQAADKAGVLIVTGDTKVVGRGKADKVFINTSGVGEVYADTSISPDRCEPGDKIILNGSIADHGIAVMAARENFELENTIESDAAPLNGLVDAVLDVTRDIHVLRDATRGGIASALNEIAKSSGVDMVIHDDKIEVKENVRGVCEILGFDPLYVANEGKLIVIAPAEDSNRLLAAMKSQPYGENSVIIGEVTETSSGSVTLKTSIGTSRIVEMLTGEQLPRIC